MFFPKASLLAFYFGLIPITYPRLRKALVVGATWITLACIASFLIDTIWCRPVSDNWYGGPSCYKLSIRFVILMLCWPRNLNPASCSIFESRAVLRTNWILDITSDLLGNYRPAHLAATGFLVCLKKTYLCLSFRLATSYAPRPASAWCRNAERHCNILSGPCYDGCEYCQVR